MTRTLGGGAPCESVEDAERTEGMGEMGNEERRGRWSAIGRECMNVFCVSLEAGMTEWNTCRYNVLLWLDSL